MCVVNISDEINHNNTPPPKKKKKKKKHAQIPKVTAQKNSYAHHQNVSSISVRIHYLQFKD